MSLPSRLSHVPAPPFEPTSLLLNGRVGWSGEGAFAWDKIETGDDGGLRLARDPQSLRRLTEASGSFGGLVPPSPVAMSCDGTVFLLDRPGHRLKRFDFCICKFQAVAGIGGEGGGAREWRDPGGIAMGCGKLYVCDSGRETAPTQECQNAAATNAKLQRENHRVSVFDVTGLALHGHLRPPTDIAAAWRPVAVALDGNGYAYVADSLNGKLHIFSPRLNYAGHLDGFANPVAVSVDDRGFIFVLCEISPQQYALRVVDAQGSERPAPESVEKAAPWFPPLPFTVDAEGRLDLSGLCLFRPQTSADCEQSRTPPASLVFDDRGEPVMPQPAAPVLQFAAAGTAVLGPLDSKTRGCVWHRIVLTGELPWGTRLTVDTFTAEEPIPSGQLQDFALWETGQTAQAFEQGRWDCLSRSGPGRYLWLRLSLAGNGTATPVVGSIAIEFPRIGSRQYLPAVFGGEPASSDFTDRYLALFDTTLYGIERTIDTSPGWFDPWSAPAERVGQAPVDFLSWLASWVGLRFDRGWDVAKRRVFLKRFGRILDRRGTLGALRDALILLLGLDRGAGCACPCEPVTRCGCRPSNCAPPEEKPWKWTTPPLILEHFRVRRWLYLGQGRLGERSILWGQRIVNRSQLDVNAQADATRLVARPDPLRDPFHTHAHQFTVFVPACVRHDDTRRRALENLLASESPAHTRYYVEYVEPRFRIGVQSTLGFDAVIAAPPKTLALGEEGLGRSVLGAPPGERDDSRKLGVGTHSRVGISTRFH